MCRYLLNKAAFLSKSILPLLETRLAFGVAMAAGSVVTLLFPAAAKTSVQLAIVARAGLGLLHAIGCPALTGAWGA